MTPVDVPAEVHHVIRELPDAMDVEQAHTVANHLLGVLNVCSGYANEPLDVASFEGGMKLATGLVASAAALGQYLILLPEVTEEQLRTVAAAVSIIVLNAAVTALRLTAEAAPPNGTVN